MSRIDTIRSALQAMAPTLTRTDDAHFFERVRALDALEIHILELADGIDTSEHRESRLALHRRALAMQAQLQQSNESMFQRYRDVIATKTFDRTALINQFASFAETIPQNAKNNLLYDSLDDLIVGILNEDQPLDEMADLEPEMVPYQPTPARVVLELIRRSGIGTRDVFCDIGAGLGHVPLLVSLLTGAAAIGIELQPAYCAYAQQCATRLRIENVRFICQDARDAVFSTATMFYMYTPFKGVVLRQVLEKLHSEAEIRAFKLCVHGPYLSEMIAQSQFTAFRRLGDSLGFDSLNPDTLSPDSLNPDSTGLIAMFESIGRH